MEVYKFGGASVNSAEAVKNVAEILRTYAQGKTLVVFSAMGKMTNSLEKVLEAFYYKKEEKEALLKEVLIYHLNTLSVLFPEIKAPVYSQLKESFQNLGVLLKRIHEKPYDQAYDAVVSYGERFSTLIMSAYLEKSGIPNIEADASKLIRCDLPYREGKVNWEVTEKLVRENAEVLFAKVDIIITQGFIGGDEKGNTLTLGREGSDYSAAIFAYCLNVSKLSIWKDVPGVLNADPKYFKKISKLPFISYLDATEQAYYGASIIHPHTIKPLQNKSIPLHVRSFLDPASEGTWVMEERGDIVYKKVPSYIFKRNQILISIRPKDFSFIAEENLSALFSSLVKYKIRLNLMQNSALSFSFCIDDAGQWKELINLLNQEFEVLYNEGLELITVRYYTEEVIENVVNKRAILLEQKSRTTAQLLVI